MISIRIATRLRHKILPAPIKNNRTTYLFISVIHTEENLNSPIHGIRNNLFIDNYFGS
ncbi:hypothetical protein Ctu_1p00890 (plasmid) [Cronobacter turicensis z3032]|uniref:Uncharacterized protein n=1 Tax=Cronobacter turicensis (strain DSM 18703 / CCUG 55852 / LMG 23827 / z3032) TaxID=693216 RepID=C9Y5I1_CROTZ|nr:hypothetical protein Ctu_1p00890 [Cronobacter turicensis z3032]